MGPCKSSLWATIVSVIRSESACDALWRTPVYRVSIATYRRRSQPGVFHGTSSRDARTDFPMLRTEPRPSYLVHKRRQLF
ncbi:hypothetical protein Y600_5906 [Burkholderia pseudomallei MSHR3709]|nr:hypothetical protein Y600_5906 [Burkholderia pseudomallei MSHR3709]